VKELSLDALLNGDWLEPLNGTGGAVAIYAEAQTILSGLPPERLRLPDEEDARIARYRQAEDRAARRAAHGLVRHCLGALLAAAPRDLSFIRDDKGRPFLARESRLDFNLTHSGACIGIGLTANGRIGVDVQEMSQSFEWRSIASAFLHDSEIVAVENLPENLQNRTALEYWSLKEAFLKATGEGIAIALHHLAPEKTVEGWRLSRNGLALQAGVCGFRDDVLAAWATSGAVPQAFIVRGA